MVNRWKRQFNWFIRSIWQASQKWSRCDCVDLSAAFAYYALQSFFPILLISLSVASWFLGKQQGLDEQIIDLAAQVLPDLTTHVRERCTYRHLTGSTAHCFYKNYGDQV